MVLPGTHSAYLVSGAGTALLDGVYSASEGETHEGCPVHTGLNGFSLTASQQPEADTGRARWGWILGRNRVPAYAAPCPATDHAQVPRQGWQCFKGEEPAPEVVPLRTPDELACAYAREAHTAVLGSDLKRAMQCFSLALESGGPEFEADWARKAGLYFGRAKVAQILEKHDQVLSDADAALVLQPNLLPALLLRAQALHEMGRVSDAALSSKQCWLLNRQAAALEPDEEGKTRKTISEECEKLLLELGEVADSSIPRHRDGHAKLPPLSDANGTAGSEDDAMPVLADRILSVQVRGSGSRDCLGTYLPQGQTSNGEPIYESARGFKLSLEVLPMKNTKEAKYGWVLGRDRIGYYGARTGKTSRPPAEGWRPLGVGKAPAPSCVIRSARPHKMAVQGHNAMVLGDATEAAAAFTAALEEPGAAGDLLERARVLCDLARALEEAGRLQDARDRIEESIALFPGDEEAYLQRASILDAAGNPAEAVRCLQQLLTMQPESDRGALLIHELAPQVPSANEWLNFHKDIIGDEKQEKRPVPKSAEEELLGQLRELAARGPTAFEDSDSTVYAHWTLPSEIVIGDLQVDISVERLSIKVRDVHIYDQDLAHKVVPSQSSWTFDAPDVAVTLCKGMEKGAYPKWGVLKAEALHEKRARWGGMPFDPATAKTIMPND